MASGRRLAKCLLALTLGVGGVLLAVFSTDTLTAWRLPGAYFALIGAAAALPLSAALAWHGPARAPSGPLAAGVTFIAGGAAFDVGATLWHTPDLAQEANVVARTLLDSGHSVGFVLAAAGVAQFALTAALICAWVGLLRHRNLILTEVPIGGAVLPTLKAATGGASLTWRQWLLPLGFAELPGAYHLWWATAVVLVGGSASRWYLGLEWFGLVPSDWASGQLVVVAVGCTAGLSAYVLWLSSAARSPGNGPASPGNDGP